MKKNNLSLIIVGMIMLLGAWLYLYKLGEIPPGLGLDEAPNGVNAYSILLTGRDEYGKSFPISFKFSGSFSLPLYTYLTVPFISLFGLTLTSVRVVSATTGILSILLIFVFLKNLNVIRKRSIIYLGTFLYAISPWTVMYSRSGYEAILSFLIYMLGVFFIWKGFKRPQYLTFGIVLLSLSMYASHTNKFLVPLLLTSLFLVFRKLFLNVKSLKYIVLGSLSAFIIQLPNLSLFFTKSFFVKNSLFYGDNLFSQYEQIKNFVPSFIGIPYLFVREFLSQYFNYFSLRSLFMDPDPFEGRSIPSLSVFYPWMFIPYLVGLYLVWKKRSQINYKFILILALVAPIPAALTGDPFWTYRAIPLLAPIIIFITLGIGKISEHLNRNNLILLSSLIIAYSLLLLWKGYFIYLPNEKASAWQYGYRNLANEISKNKTSHFVIDNTRTPTAYLQIAFFMKTSPEVLQNSVSDNSKTDYYNNVNIQTDRAFNNLEIRGIEWKTDPYIDQIIVGDNLAFSDEQISEHELTGVFEIKDPLDKVVFKGFKTNPSKKCAKEIKIHLILNPMCRDVF